MYVDKSAMWFIACAIGRLAGYFSWRRRLLDGSSTRAKAERKDAMCVYCHDLPP